MKQFLTLCWILSALVSHAQMKVAELSFNETTHDFGQFPEEGGVVSTTFILTNIGDKPCSIQEVKASCACTASQWSSAPILPGGSSTLVCSYNPANRPGHFTKSMSVYTNIKATPYALYITGEALPRPKTKEELYPVALGKLRLEADEINLGTIDSKKVHQKKIAVYNPSNEAISLRFDQHSPFINISCIPEQLAPNATGHILVKYNAKTKNDWGLCYDNFTFIQNDKHNKQYRIRLQANIVDKSEDWDSKQLAQAPVIVLNTNTFTFPDTPSESTITCPFTITNTGKTALVIHKIKHTCSCTTDNYDGKSIAPGKSLTLHFTLDTKHLSGLQRKKVILYTNAPEKNMISLAIQGKVIKTDN